MKRWVSHYPENEVLRYFVFFLSSHFCVLTQCCRRLLIFIATPVCTLLGINCILQSSLFLIVGGQILWSGSGLFEGPVASVVWSKVPSGILIAKLPTMMLSGRQVLVSCVARHSDIAALLLTWDSSLQSSASWRWQGVRQNA